MLIRHVICLVIGYLIKADLKCVLAYKRSSCTIQARLVPTAQHSIPTPPQRVPTYNRELCTDLIH